MKTRQENHFSLIELLIVISIIAILAAMLLPALGRARDKAHAITCMNNLKQQGIYVIHYSDTYNNYVPPYSDSSGYMYSTLLYMMFTPPNKPYYYMGKEFLCPKIKKFYGYPTAMDTVNHLNYVYNAFASKENMRKTTSFVVRGTGRQHSPSQQLLVADGAYDLAMKPMWDSGFWNDYTINNPLQLNFVGAVHSKKANILWVDGHVSPESTHAIYQNQGIWHWW